MNRVIGHVLLTLLPLTILFTPSASGQPITSYDDLANQIGPGSIHLTAPLISGTFDYSSSVSNDCNIFGLAIPANGGGYWVRQFPYSETEPIELDWFQLADGDDITKLLSSLAACYAPDLYVRAPSQDRRLLAQFIAWNHVQGLHQIKRFAFLESNRATTIIEHHRYPLDSQGISTNPYFGSSTSGAYRPFYVQVATQDRDPVDDLLTLWWFQDYDWIKIGGEHHHLTFQSIHPGLGDNRFTQAEKQTFEFRGLLEFRLDHSYTNAELVDFRANVRDTNGQGLNFTGRGIGQQASTIGRTEQVRIAGLYWNSSVRVHSGVSQVWYDPDHTTASDPYLIQFGWDGSRIPARDANGNVLVDVLPRGCFDPQRKQWRTRMLYTLNVDSVTGGVTLEYGAPNANIFLSRNIGQSQSDPFVVRYRNIGLSGPNPLGLPAGVAAKKHGREYIVIKHDTMFEYGHTAADFRFLRIEELPTRLGNYVHWGKVDLSHPDDQCAADNSLHWQSTSQGAQVYVPQPPELLTYSGPPRIWRAEASRDGSISPYRTAFLDVEFENITPWFLAYTHSVEMIQPRGAGADYISTDPNDVPDRSYGHIVRSAPNTIVPGVTGLSDQNTLTGPGAWQYVHILPVLLHDQSPAGVPGMVPAADNVLENVTITHSVGVGVSLLNIDPNAYDSSSLLNSMGPAGNTVLQNVEFTCNDAPKGDGFFGHPRNLTGHCERVVMYIGDDSDVHAWNISAHIDSEIVALSDGSGTPGTLTINGAPQTLPFAFGRTDTDGDLIVDEQDPDPLDPNIP